MFVKQFYKHQNVHSSTYFLVICTARGFGVLMDWMCLLYIASVVLFVMLFPGGEYTSELHQLLIVVH